MVNSLDALRAQARQADALHAKSRQLLVEAVRQGTRDGLSQRDIAIAIGRSQPEVSRLLRFHGTSVRARALRKHRGEVIDMAAQAGVTNLRVFGSVARGIDNDESDIDLLGDFSPGISLMGIARLEREIGAVVGFPIDIVPARTLRAHLAEQVLKDATPI